MVNNTTVLTILPLGIGVITFAIPDFSMLYMWLVLGLYIPLFLFAVYLDLTGKSKKSARLRGYVGYFSFVLTSIYFALPAVRVFQEKPVIQLAIIGLWIAASIFTFWKNELMHSIVIGESDEHRKYSFILHGTMFFTLAAGGGGYYKAAEYFSFVFGENATFAYFSIILWIASLWMTIIAQSSVGVFTKFRK